MIRYNRFFDKDFAQSLTTTARTEISKVWLDEYDFTDQVYDLLSMTGKVDEFEFQKFRDYCNEDVPIDHATAVVRYPYNYIPLPKGYTPYSSEYVPTPAQALQSRLAGAAKALQGLRQAWKAGRL